MKFLNNVDSRTIIFKAGNGGRGGISFDRGAYIPYGKPNGGNGAQGASILLRTNSNIAHLANLKSIYFAQNGVNGRNKLQHGKKPDDLIIDVPTGTCARLYEQTVTETLKLSPYKEMKAHVKNWTHPNNDTKRAERLIGEIDLDKKNVIAKIAQGGLGGKGNPYFSSPGNSPRVAGPGDPGQIVKAELELKSLADVGLIGFPNSGKSSLVCALTNSDSKVADYPFTTLQPSIGMCLNRDYFNGNSTSRLPESSQIRIADIPGLIQGASENKGLGHRFLKHIERCKMLLVVIDAFPEKLNNFAFKKTTLLDNYSSLIKELREYKYSLLEIPRSIIFSKIDLLDSDSRNRLNYTILRLKGNENILKCSTLSNSGILGKEGLGNHIINKLSLL